MLNVVMLSVIMLNVVALLMLQNIVVSVATANVMGQHAIPKQNQSKNSIPSHIHILMAYLHIRFQGAILHLASSFQRKRNYLLV